MTDEHVKPVPQVMQNTLSSDLICRPEFMSGATLLAPFAQHCASQRLMMWNSHASQAVVLDHAEQPNIMTGYESIFGRYEYSTCRVSQDMVVRAKIPKFNPMTFHKIGNGKMPSELIVYVGNDDGKVHCMEVSSYTMLNENFGYFNKTPGADKDLLYEGSFIPKGEVLTTSPAHDGAAWGMGLNANVVFLGDWGSTEDAFVVSRSLADRGTNTAIHQVRLDIDPKTVPLDLYGDGVSHICFPKIGDRVRHDGSLIAIRKVNPSTFVPDMTPERLRTIEQIHDEDHMAVPGSEIIDVDVFINEDAVKKMDSDKTLYQQFFDFAECRRYQYDQILNVYEQLCIREGLPCGEDFSNMVVRAATLSNNKKYIKKRIKLCDGREPIEFIKVVITYANKRKITVGTKLTGREGARS